MLGVLFYWLHLHCQCFLHILLAGVVQHTGSVYLVQVQETALGTPGIHSAAAYEPLLDICV